MSINKNRPIISYNNIALFQSDPYQLGNMTGANSGQNLNFLPFVESIDFAVIHPEQSVAQIGSKKFAQKNYFGEPSVSLKINCREDFTDLFQNQTAFQDLIEGDENNSTNFYAIIRDSRENDGVQLKEGSDVISFGNCFFNGVSLTQNVRGVLQASYDFVASNVQAQKLEHRVMYYNDFEHFTPEDHVPAAYGDSTHPMNPGVGGQIFTYQFQDDKGLVLNRTGVVGGPGDGDGVTQSINASGMPGDRSLVISDSFLANTIGFHGVKSTVLPSGGLLNQHSKYVVSGTFRTDYKEAALQIDFATGLKSTLGLTGFTVRDTRSSSPSASEFAVTGSFEGAESGVITIANVKQSGYESLSVMTGDTAYPVVGGYTGGLSAHVSGIHSSFVYLHTGNFATANPAGFTFGEAFSGVISSGFGRLACIDNRLKYHKFTGQFGTNPPKGWIGLTDSPYYGGEETNSISTQSGKRAAFTWINGLPVGTGYYHRGLPVSGLTGNDVWHFPEPNNAGGSEHFIHTRGVGGIGLTGQYSWNDNQDGSRQSGFFVERVNTPVYISDLTIKKLDEFQITAPSFDLTGTQTQYITGFFEKDRYDGHKLVFQSDFLNTYKNRINNGIAFRSVLSSNKETSDIFSTGSGVYAFYDDNFENNSRLRKFEPTLTFNIEPDAGSTTYPKFHGIRYGNARSHSDDISIEDGATYVVEGECRIISGGSNNKATCKIDICDRAAEFRTSSTTFVPFRLTADTSHIPGYSNQADIEARRFLDIGVSSSNADGDENTGPVAGEFKNLKVYKVAGDFKDRVIPGYTTNVSVKKNAFDPDEFVTVKLNQNVNPEEAAILFGLKSKYAGNEYNDSDNLTEQLRIEIPRGNLVHNRVDLQRGVALAKVVLVDGEFKLADSGKFDTYSSSIGSHQTREEAHDFIDNVGEGEILAMITADTIANGSAALGGITGRLASGFNSQLIGDYTHRDGFVFVGARGQNPIFEELSDDDARLMQEDSEQPQATVYLPTENHEFLVQSDAVQNFNLSLPISRKDIKSIGKRYPLTRKAMHPNEGNFSLTSLVSNTVSAGLQTDGFRTKTENLQTFTNQNTDYTINISGEKLNSDTYQLKIRNAKLQQSSFNSQIGGALNSNMSFGFSKDDFQYIDTTFEDAYAYSLSRKMNPNYTGYAFQARRMWDNSLVGVGFNKYGVVSGDSPVTLLDTGFGTGILSGTNLFDYVTDEADNLADYKTFVPRIYSQGIPGNDLTGRPWDSGETFQVSFGNLYNSTWDDDIAATKFALSGTFGAGAFPINGRISPRDPVWTGNDNGTMFAFYKNFFGTSSPLGTRWVITEGEFISSGLSTGNLALRAMSNGSNNPAIFYNRPWYFNETIERWTVFNPATRIHTAQDSPFGDETISFTLLGDQYLSQPIIGNRNNDELLYYSSGGKLGIDFNDDGADVQMCSEYPIVASGGTIGCVIENDVLGQTNRTIWAFYTGTGSISSGDNTYSRLYYSGGDTYDSTKIGYGAKFSGNTDNGRLFNSFDEVNPEIKLYNKHMDAVGGGSATGQLDYIVMHNTFNTEGNYAGNEINNQFILNGIQAQFSQDAMKKGVLTPVGGEILSVGGHSDDDTSKSEYFNGHLYELFVFTGSGRYQNSREYYTKELERFYDIPKRSAEISGGNAFE